MEILDRSAIPVIEDAPAKPQSAMAFFEEKKAEFSEERRRGRKPAKTTRELENELYQINAQIGELDAKAIQIRAQLKERY